MSKSQRIGDSTKEKLNMLQARIILLKRQKYSLTELIDKITSFSIQHENEFFEFITKEKPEEDLNLQKEKFFEFLLTPIEGAGPEDYEEYDYEED